MESLLVSKNEHERSAEETQSNKRKVSLANCGTCGAEGARYRCPGCLKYSCSLPCVKTHKSESGCCGLRDKTAFVPLAKFNEMHLLSDYRFLEDTSRLVDSTHRDPLILRPRTNKYVQVLVRNAQKFNLQLKLLPPGFTRRRENSTFFHRKAAQFFWHLKLVFPQSAAEFTERRVPDDRTLQQILVPYIHPTDSDPVRRQRLKAYVRTPPDQVKVFMKAEGRRSKCIRYHELELQKSLRENLRFKVVVEYPQFHIALGEHWESYTLPTPESQPDPAVTAATGSASHGDVGGDMMSQCRVVVTPPTCAGAGDQSELEEGEIRSDAEGP